MVNYLQIPGGDLPIYRSPSGVQTFLSTVPATTVLATGSVASVTLSVSGQQYTAINVSGLTVNSVAWPRNTTIWIGSAAGKHDIGIYRLRKAYSPGSNVFSVGEIGLSDDGLVPIAMRLAEPGAGQYIAVMADFSPWTIYPRINTTLIPPFLKDWDQAWAGETIFPAPILNMGGHQSFMSAGNGQSISFTCTPSAGIWPTLKSPQALTVTAPPVWALTAGSVNQTGTGAPNSQFNFSPITWTVPPGFHVLQASVTGTNDPATVAGSSGGTTAAQVRYICIWVHDGYPGDPGATFPPVAIQAVMEDHLTLDGSSISITLYSQDAANLRDGSMVNVWDLPYYTGGAPASIIAQRPGYVTEIDQKLDPGLKEATVTILGMGKFAQTMAANSQRIDSIQSGTLPISWQETPSVLAIPSYMIAYLLRYQTNILELTDFYPNFTFTNYSSFAYIVPKGNVWAQLNEVGIRTLCNVTCDSHGEILIMPHPNMIPLTDASPHAYNRYSFIFIADTLNPLDYNTVTINRNMRNTVGRVIGEGFAGDLYTSSVPQAQGLPIPRESYAPGGTGTQGGGEERLTNQLITGQTDLNQRTGLYLAWKNNPFPQVNITIEGNRWCYEPANLQLLTLNVPASATADGLPVSSNFVITSARRNHSASGMVTVTLEAEAETYGTPGVTIVIPTPADTIHTNATPPPGAAPPPTKPNPCSAANWPAGWSVVTGIMGATPGANPPASSAVKGVLQPPVLEYGLYPTLVRSKAVITYSFSSPQTIHSATISVAEGWVGTYEGGWSAVSADILDFKLYDATGTAIFDNAYGGPADSTVAVAAINWSTTGATSAVTFFLGDRPNVSSCMFSFIGRPASSIGSNRAYVWITAAQICTT